MELVLLMNRKRRSGKRRLSLLRQGIQTFIDRAFDWEPADQTAAASPDAECKGDTTCRLNDHATTRTADCSRHGNQYEVNSPKQG